MRHPSGVPRVLSLYSHAPPNPHPCIRWSVLHHHSFVSSRMLVKWSHTVCNLLTLASFIQHYYAVISSSFRFIAVYGCTTNMFVYLLFFDNYLKHVMLALIKSNLSVSFCVWNRDYRYPFFRAQNRLRVLGHTTGWWWPWDANLSHTTANWTFNHWTTCLTSGVIERNWSFYLFNIS